MAKDFADWACYRHGRAGPHWERCQECTAEDKPKEEPRQPFWDKSTYPSGDHRLTAMKAILNERDRQEQLKLSGRFKYTAADKECPDVTRLAMLTEELGEVARAMMKQPHDGATNIYTELTQVAAITLAWMEYLVKEA